MREHIQEGVLEAALERAKGKVLPVVVYQDGKRTIVGEALVEEDGTLTAEIGVEGCRILNLHTDIRGLSFVEEP